MASSFVAAVDGWNLHYIDDDTGLPFDTGQPSMPVIAWKIEDGGYCIPVVPGEQIANQYVIVAPDGRAIVPEYSEFSTMAEAVQSLRELRQSS